MNCSYSLTYWFVPNMPVCIGLTQTTTVHKLTANRAVTGCIVWFFKVDTQQSEIFSHLNYAFSWTPVFRPACGFKKTLVILFNCSFDRYIKWLNNELGSKKNDKNSSSIIGMKTKVKYCFTKLILAASVVIDRSNHESSQTIIITLYYYYYK